MNKEKFSPIALAILALLYEAPMHPYRMQQLIKERGKDQVINVRQRASLYQTINRLLRADLIIIQETERDEKRPERTIYTLTERGRDILFAWLRETLSTPAKEFPHFPTALAYLPLLSPAEARSQLEKRAIGLQKELELIDTELSQVGKIVPRLFLIESEYLRAMLIAELTWVGSVIRELSSGDLTWSDEWLRKIAAELTSPQEHRS